MANKTVSVSVCVCLSADCLLLLLDKLVDCICLDGEYRQLPSGTMVRSGFGIHLSSDSTIYMGNWDNDKMNGSGQIQFSSGAIYEGEFVNNCFHGKGQYTWPNGSRFEGMFDNNRFLLLLYYYRISSNRSRALNTSRASNTGRGSDVIVLIEAGP